MAKKDIEGKIEKPRRELGANEPITISCATARLNNASDRKHRSAAAKRRRWKIKDAKHAIARYEDEVLKSPDGSSSFSPEMLALLIAKAEAELKHAKREYAQLTSDTETERGALRKIDAYYDEFIG